MQTIVTPTLVSATAEPLTLEEAKAFLRVDAAQEDVLITALLTAARQWFEVATDRQFTTAVWVMKLPNFHGCIELPYPPLRSVSSVTYLLGAVDVTLDAAVYDVVTTRTPGFIAPVFGTAWPVPDIHPEAVTITFSAGYGAPAEVPELVKTGIKLLLAHWYDHRGDTATVPDAVQLIANAAMAHRF